MILSVAQLKAALASLGGGEDEETIEFHKGPGHSGEGIYVSIAEYPDEGSVFLGPQA